MNDTEALQITTGMHGAHREIVPAAKRANWLTRRASSSQQDA